MARGRPRIVLPDDVVEKIRERRKAGKTIRDIAKEFGISESLVSRETKEIGAPNWGRRPSHLNVKELRAALMERGYTFEQLAECDKKALQRMLTDEQRGRVASNILDTGAIEVEDPLEEAGSSETAEEVPSPHDEKWQDYVLGHFFPDEMENGNPRVEGLRRVASQLVGPITEEGCDLVSSPSEANGHRACAKAWVVFDTTMGNVRYESLADAGPDNTPGEFGRFPTSLAHTRAIGRCFRAALGLRRIIAAEELASSSPDMPMLSNEAIHTAQISVIQIMADRLKVNVLNMMKELGIEKADIRSLTREEGIAVAQKLNEIQQQQQQTKPKKGKGKKS